MSLIEVAISACGAESRHGTIAAGAIGNRHHQSADDVDRFLIDHNIVIKSDPDGAAFEADADLAMELQRLASQFGRPLLVHQATIEDIRRDTDPTRLARREILWNKYAKLESWPRPSPAMVARFGDPPRDSNDWVDMQLLAAVSSNAVVALVTEDGGIVRRAADLGLADRVISVGQATGELRRLLDVTTDPPANVRSLRGPELVTTDPIWESFRVGYPGFDDWFARAVQREGRPAWVIDGPGGGYDAVAIVARQDGENGLPGKVLKVCSFKVESRAAGLYNGELLLRTILDHARTGEYDAIFVEVDPAQAPLMVLLGQFGFVDEGSKGRDRVMVKRLQPGPDTAALSRHERYVRHGPGSVELVDDHVWLIPIQPQFHEMLFPPVTQQLTMGLAPARPYGNALRKAYVSSSPVRTVEPGDVLLFYRSEDLQAVTTIGVADAVDRFESIDPLVRFVSRRTVYSQADLEARLTTGPALAVLFRYDRSLAHPIPLTDLIQNQAAMAAPQSFTKARSEGIEWLRKRIEG